MNEIWDAELRHLIALQAENLRDTGLASGRQWSLTIAQRLCDLTAELCRRYEAAEAEKAKAA